MYITDKTERKREGGCAGIEPTRLRQTTASPHIIQTLDSDRGLRGVSLGLGENQRPHVKQVQQHPPPIACELAASLLSRSRTWPDSLTSPRPARADLRLAGVREIER